MKEAIKIFFEFLKIFKKIISESKKKKNEKDLKNVREAIKEIDLNGLRDSILDRKQ